jgi:hypothetical protein
MLIIRQTLTLISNWAIPIEAESSQTSQYLPNSAFLLAWWVDIFDTKMPAAMITACL